MAKKRKPVTIAAESPGEPLPVEMDQDAWDLSKDDGLDAILDADFSSPTTLKIGRNNFAGNNPAYRYYREIAPNLAQWWTEFAGELEETTGGPKYKTIHQFARAKSKVPQQQVWIEQMIGAEPAAFNCRDNRKSGRWIKVPWLGDWKARRINGYWAPEHPAKIKSLVRSLKEKLNGFEAVRSAAPFLVQMMARYTRLGEQVDQVFGGQALDISKGPTEQNKSRFYTYLEMQKSVTRIQLRLLHEWMLAHGVSTSGEPVHVTQVNNMLVQAGQSPAGLADGMTNKDLQAIKLARMLQVHADNFEMPLPGTDTKPPIQEEKPQKGNGKVM